MLNCWSCGSDLGALRKVLREELCPGCQTWVHCCKNCHFWDEAGRSCDEPAAEWVHDRERGNFCDFFAMRAEAAQGGSGPAAPPSGRAAFDKLFKK